ncbi:MAG: VacB/RNase II family 3'-5' exoribonuclease [bacterium]|nr:VacB/RNase II family 3'-5' exoribonuclease [bacterium]
MGSKGGREAIVRDAGPPGVAGQWLEVEDREGVRWVVECLGEPVEAGAQIGFQSIPPEEARRGQLVRVIEAARIDWVCRVRRPRGDVGPFELTPFGGLAAPELRLSERDAKGAVDGDRVLVVPLDSGKRGRNRSRDRHADRAAAGSRRSGLSVRVVEVLGPAGDPDSDHRAVAWKHRLPQRFSRRARLEADSIDEEWTDEGLRGRADLRHLPFITIDPSSARDHDDALYAEERPADPVLRIEGDRPRSRSPQPPTWTRRLWVAIADVSHFAPVGGFIDSEARRRGNSFYFPDRSIPMLPERLSSDLCSLRPEVDRLALVVELRIGADGGVIDSLFHEAVIRSRARLAYEEAAEWLARSEEEGEGASEWGGSLRCLDRIARDFGRVRAEQGALTLDLPEVEIVTDSEGRRVDARIRSRNRAHILIEEAMLAANRAVARALDRAGRRTLHRVHAPPPPNKRADLVRLFEGLGVEASGDLDDAGVLAAALEAVRGQPTQERVHIAVLRSMSQARYEAESAGHYALHFEHYLHFTSPIRRYADLEVHRALLRLIRGEPASPEPANQEGERLARLGLWLSGRERVAMEAERDAEALACCALMAGRMGEPFRAEVTGATEYGLFVRLESPSVSGLVPMRELKGRWAVDENAQALVAERSGARIAIGDVLDVCLLSVDADRGRLAFRLDRGERSSEMRRNVRSRNRIAARRAR